MSDSPGLASPGKSVYVWLTYLETAHVVDLGAESQRGKNVDGREEDPEPHIIFSKHLGIKMGLVWTGISPTENSVESLSLIETDHRKQTKTKQKQN